MLLAPQGFDNFWVGLCLIQVCVGWVCFVYMRELQEEGGFDRLRMLFGLVLI